MEKRAEMELATVNPSIGALNLHVLVSIQKEPGDETTPIVGLARFTNEKSTYWQNWEWQLRTRNSLGHPHFRSYLCVCVISLYFRV